ILDDLALAVTGAAGLADAEEPLLKADLAAPLALLAGHRPGPGPGPAAATGLAGGGPGEGDLGLGAEGGLDEIELQGVAEVAAAALLAGLARRAEELAEKAVEEIVDTAEAEAEAGEGVGTGEALRTQPVVAGSLLGIGEHRVGQGDLLEL